MSTQGTARVRRGPLRAEPWLAFAGLVAAAACQPGAPETEPGAGAGDPVAVSSTTPGTATGGTGLLGGLPDLSNLPGLPGVGGGTCPPAVANGLGVGARCTPTGGECDGLPAPYCSAQSTISPLGFCTMICDSKTVCGADAHCAPNPLRPLSMVCVPDSCALLPTPPLLLPVRLCLPPFPSATGIGRACTAGARECRGYSATLCTADIPHSMPPALCTRACDPNSGCDAYSRCVGAPGDSNTMVCMPRSCIP